MALFNRRRPNRKALDLQGDLEFETFFEISEKIRDRVEMPTSVQLLPDEFAPREQMIQVALLTMVNGLRDGEKETT